MLIIHLIVALEHSLQVQFICFRVRQCASAINAKWLSSTSCEIQLHHCPGWMVVRLLDGWWPTLTTLALDCLQLYPSLALPSQPSPPSYRWPYYPILPIHQCLKIVWDNLISGSVDDLYTTIKKYFHSSFVCYSSPLPHQSSPHLNPVTFSSYISSQIPLASYSSKSWAAWIASVIVVINNLLCDVRLWSEFEETTCERGSCLEVLDLEEQIEGRPQRQDHVNGL